MKIRYAFCIAVPWCLLIIMFLTAENIAEVPAARAAPSSQLSSPIIAAHVPTSIDKLNGAIVEPPMIRSARPSIFVSLASFRDSQCGATIEDVYSQATYPERVFVGVFQQNSKTDPDCLAFQEQCPNHPLCKYLPQMRITRIDYINATGPTGGRAAAQRLLANEDFFLQLDTHIKLVVGWDEELLAQFRATNNDMAVITTYPLPSNNMKGPAPSDDESSTPRQVPVICQTAFTNKQSSFMAKHNGATYMNPSPKPRLVPFWASGFSFSRSHVVHDVPYDPHTPYLFDGEEMGLGLRMWTSGYDFYAPTKNVAYHLYSRAGGDKPKFWDYDWAERYPIQQKAARRLWVMLGFSLSEIGLTGDYIKDDISKYGLGKRRTLKQYEEWTGINFKAHDASAARNPCQEEMQLVSA